MKSRAPRRRMARKPRGAKALSTVQKKQVRQLVRGQAESKRTCWYSSFNDGTSTARATGFATNWGYSVQNNAITANNTDCLRLIPTVLQGIDDFNRLGTRLQVQSLKLNGTIRVNLANITEQSTNDLRVVIYVLSHKIYKDYATLYANNNFLLLLDNQEGGTAPFTGTPVNEGMRVADQYYTVHAKKIITLRYAGFGIATGPSTSSIANSHNYYANYTMDLTKFLPKTLKYPEFNSGQPPEFQNAPTNSSLFMCMGFVNQQGASNFADPVKPLLQQTYVSNLTFKDS